MEGDRIVAVLSVETTGVDATAGAGPAAPYAAVDAGR